MDSILTVTTAADSQDLTTLATVKAELGIENNAQDVRLAALIRQASGIVADWCNRTFGQETVSETFRDVSCEPCLPLARTPVASVTSVTVDGEALTAAEYEADTRAGLLYRLDADGYRMSWSACKSIVVVYVGGYVLLDGLPQGIERATVLLTREFHFATARDPRVKSEEIPGVQRNDYWVGNMGGQAGALPPDVEALLAPHRRTPL